MFAGGSCSLFREIGFQLPDNSAAQSWSRLYLVPGMGHCQGGTATLDRFDMLTAIVAIVQPLKEAVLTVPRPVAGRPLPLFSVPDSVMQAT